MRANAEPAILDASVGPGHDGEAVLVVRLRHPGGAVDTVTLDAAAARRLLEHCGAEGPEQLAGRPWRELLNVIDPSTSREAGQ